MLDLDSLFKLSYGMCVVTSKCEGKYNGCIVNTVLQITPDPPMVVVSVNRECLTNRCIDSSGVFAVSILSQTTPMPFIGRFGFKSGSAIDKFEGVNYKTGLTGSPIVLDNTIAFLEAEVTQKIDIETHTLFIGKIVACKTLDETQPPMTYAYYRNIRHGKTPDKAATYHRIEDKKQNSKERGKPMQKYECTVCGYIYDPQKGDADNGVEPGTAFEDLPDDWICPECGVGKDEFKPVKD